MNNEMNPLNLDRTTREKLWGHLGEMIEKYKDEVAGKVVNPRPSIDRVKEKIAAFDFSSPREALEVLREVYGCLESFQLHSAHPDYFGVFNPNPVPMGIVADTLVALFNPQLASTASSIYPIYVEKYLIEFWAKQFGFRENKIDGTFCSGGALANHTALLCALNHRFPDFLKHGAQSIKGIPCLYVGEETHHSFWKASKLCGIGTHSIRAVPVLNDLTIDSEALENKIKEDLKIGHTPLMVVGTLGSTSAGVVDPMRFLSQLAQKYNLWFHVDGAFGAPCALLPECQKYLDGVEKADSLTMDAHKWPSIPMGAGMFFTQHPGLLRNTFALEHSPYMPAETLQTELSQPYQESLQWSRRFMGLKLYMAMAVAGVEGFQKVFRHQIDLAYYLRRRLIEAGWQVVNQTDLPVVCINRPQLDKSIDWPKVLANDLANTGKAWVTPTALKSGTIPVLRLGISNYLSQKHNIDRVVSLLDQAFKNYRSNFYPKTSNQAL